MAAARVEQSGVPERGVPPWALTCPGEQGLRLPAPPMPGRRQPSGRAPRPSLGVCKIHPDFGSNVQQRPAVGARLTPMGVPPVNDRPRSLDSDEVPRDGSHRLVIAGAGNAAVDRMSLPSGAPADPLRALPPIQRRRRGGPGCVSGSLGCSRSQGETEDLSLPVARRTGVPVVAHRTGGRLALRGRRPKRRRRRSR